MKINYLNEQVDWKSTEPPKVTEYTISSVQKTLANLPIGVKIINDLEKLTRATELGLVIVISYKGKTQTEATERTILPIRLNNGRIWALHLEGFSANTGLEVTSQYRTFLTESIQWFKVIGTIMLLDDFEKAYDNEHNPELIKKLINSLSHLDTVWSPTERYLDETTNVLEILQTHFTLDLSDPFNNPILLSKRFNLVYLKQGDRIIAVTDCLGKLGIQIEVFQDNKSLGNWTIIGEDDPVSIVNRPSIEGVRLLKIWRAIDISEEDNTDDNTEDTKDDSDIFNYNDEDIKKLPKRILPKSNIPINNTKVSDEELDNL